jgi:Holliday junction resolvasome RuvABC endonuclease subunit
MCIQFKPDWNNSEFYFLTDVKKYEGPHFLGQVNGQLHSEYKTQEERFHQISDYFIKQLERLRVSPNTPVYIEDYSMGSKGRVFHIAENTGLLKHKLWALNYGITTIPPTVIKKVATGKGNAKKEQMYEAFVKQTGIKLQTMGSGKNIGSPVSDIVDAYFIAQYGYTLTHP